MMKERGSLGDADLPNAGESAGAARGAGGQARGAHEQADKVRAIRFLNDRGTLRITKSGDRFDKHFGLSKHTLYSYLFRCKNGESIA